jgi:hypothetical protein
LLLASIAALVATSFEAHAAPVARASAATGHELATAGDAELGARKRVRVRRGNNAAGLAMMGMMVGTIGAVVAAQQRRDYYDSYDRRAYGYYGYQQPYAYPAQVYQPNVYRQRRVYNQPQVYNRQPQVYRQQRTINPNVPNQQWHDRLQRVDPQNPNSANPTGVPRIGW